MLPRERCTEFNAPLIHYASVSYLFTINLELRQFGCSETEAWRKESVSELPTLVTLQWVCIGGAAGSAGEKEH